MIIDLPLILLCLTVFTGIVTLFYSFVKRGDRLEKPMLLVDYSRSLFPVFLIVFLLRSFVVQPYRVPTGSLEPTIVPGDFIVVSQFQYGVHLPVWNKEIIPVSHPKRGQIALFYWPVDPHITFVKRVIGVPGDIIDYVGNVLTINGKTMIQKYMGDNAIQQEGQSIRMAKYEENLDGLKHGIYVCAKNINNCPGQGHNFYHLKIPKGYYLMMGDNRNDSDDSRDWGFVPEHDFIGRAMFIWLSWDSNAPWYNKIRFNRIGTKL